MEQLPIADRVLIQDATVADIPGVEAVRAAVWKSTYPKLAPDYITEADVDAIFTDDYINAAIERGQRAVDSPDHHIGVAKDGEDVIGFVLAIKTSEDHGEVRSIYVLDEFQRQGLGPRLLEGALTWLEPEKRVITLDVLTTNEHAIALYERYGFTIYREIPPETPDPPLKYMPHIEMLRQPGSIE